LPAEIRDASHCFLWDRRYLFSDSSGRKPSWETGVRDQLLLCEITDRVATLILNRPAKKNSLSPELIDRLQTRLEQWAGRDDIRTVIIRGAGNEAFCSGYDIGSLPVADAANPPSDMERTHPIESLFEAVHQFPYPVIAMLNGHAFGAGYELAVCCDIRIAADNIKIGMPPAKLGLVYPWTGLKRFVSVLGLAGTRQLFFSGGAFAGDQLEKMRLADIILAPEALEAFTCRMASDIAANAPLALKGTKRVLNLLQHAEGMRPGAIAEAEQLTRDSFASRDLKEGQRAFLEKRKPVFTGE
jgi:enoyl-CoA hydratase/carnithine racemase